MYFRCPNCLVASATGIGPAGRGLTCSGCETTYPVEVGQGLGSTVKQRYRRIVAYSIEHRIDSPSACSVLVGLMTLEQARRIAAGRIAEAAMLGGDRAKPVGRTTSFLAGLDLDPAFEPAIAAGHLTVTEAARRGVRQSYAAGLVARHRLSKKLAYLVADNRLTLKKALEARDRAEEHHAPPPPRRTTTARQKILVIGSAAILLGLMTWSAWSRTRAFAGPRHPGSEATPPWRIVAEAASRASPVPETPQARRLATTEIDTDDQGRLTRLVGPDPETVLVAYCRSASGGSGFLEPLEITETVPPSRTARLGVFRDLGAFEVNRAIRIRQEWKSRRWVAGTGEDPVHVDLAPELPEDARRVPVRPR